MKTQEEIIREIKQTVYDNMHVLTGSVATVQVNAPRALQQVTIENKLRALYWVIGQEYKSKLKGINR